MWHCEEKKQEKMSCTLLYTDPEKMRQLEVARKVAFMMAWHPRLGAHALIRRFVPKDVGKLIANKYLSAEAQLVRCKKPLLLHKPDPETQIAVNGDVKTMPGRTLQLTTFSIIDKSLHAYESLRVQTPLMTIVFDQQPHEENTHLVLQLGRPDQDRWFCDWMRDLDESFVTGLMLVDTKPRQRRDDITQLFLPTFRRGVREGPGLIHLRLPPPKLWERMVVYDKFQKPMGSFRTNYDNGVFHQSAEIQVIMRHTGVWFSSASRFTNQWTLEQVLVVRSALQVKETRQRFAFVLDDADDD